jgi:hypothetical protein
VAHRLSRLPLFTSPETRAMLRLNQEACVSNAGSGCKVFFVLADPTDPSKPLVNRANHEITLCARDLCPVVMRLDPVEGWLRDSTSHVDVRTLFPFNTFILTLYPGQKIHAVLRPALGTGIDNPRWSPCVQRYRFNRDPVWQATHPINEIIHKKTGELSLRRQFSTKPPGVCGPGESNTYDVFMKPYEVELMVVQNGKMDKKAAVLTALGYFRQSIAHFQAMLLARDEFIHKRTDDLQVTRYTVPQDTYSDAARDPAMRIYTGHTLANVFVAKMLTIITRDIIPGQVDLLSTVLVAYKVPHPLIHQVVYTVQLPVNQPLFTQFFAGKPGADMAEQLFLLAAEELMAEVRTMEAIVCNTSITI